MCLAIQLAGQCPPSSTAFSVGAAIVDAGGLLPRGMSREGGYPMVHAEESAPGKLAAMTGRDLWAPPSTARSSPAGSGRRGRARASADHRGRAAAGSLSDGVSLAWFVADGQGDELLAEAGLKAAELPAPAAPAAARSTGICPVTTRPMGVELRPASSRTGYNY